MFNTSDRSYGPCPDRTQSPHTGQLYRLGALDTQNRTAEITSKPNSRHGLESSANDMVLLLLSGALWLHVSALHAGAQCTPYDTASATPWGSAVLPRTSEGLEFGSSLMVAEGITVLVSGDVSVPEGIIVRGTLLFDHTANSRLQVRWGRRRCL